MHHRPRLALILAVVIGVVVFSGVAAILRFAIRYNRSGAAQAAREAELEAARAASRAHRLRTAQAQLPEAIPVETKAIYSGPALGNVIIKGTSALREFESELVRVEVPKKRPDVKEVAIVSTAGSASAFASSSNDTRVSAPEAQNGEQELVATGSHLVPTASTSAVAPPMDELAAFQDEIEHGGFVIVEFSQRRGRPAAPAAGESNANPDAQVPSSTEVTSDATPLRRLGFFRHQSPSVVYGAAQYYDPASPTASA